MATSNLRLLCLPSDKVLSIRWLRAVVYLEAVARKRHFYLRRELNPGRPAYTELARWDVKCVFTAVSTFSLLVLYRNKSIHMGHGSNCTVIGTGQSYVIRLQSPIPTKESRTSEGATEYGRSI